MNNKGFAISSILYGTFIIFLLLMVSSLGIISTYEVRMEKLIDESNGARDKNGGIIVSKKLYDIMKRKSVLDNVASTYVESLDGISFKKISSDKNGKGIYELSSTASDSYPVYYYRGAVTDNNVLFGGFCWKIVRTTSTGGVKMVYNGTPNDGKCNNTGSSSMIDGSKFNSNNDGYANSLGYVGYKYGTLYSISGATNDTTWMYGTGVSYSDGTYTLTDAEANGLSSTKHYTCKTTGSTCSSVYFVYYISDKTTIYYITLEDGKKVDDVIDEMLGSTANSNDSTIKKYIENWYYNNLLEYDEYLEDYLLCDEKTISNFEESGWNPDGGNLATVINFNTVSRIGNGNPTVKCDSKYLYTVANGKLKYKVGLLTVDDIMLAGGGTAYNNTYYLTSGSYYWLLGAHGFDWVAHGYIIGSNYNLQSCQVNTPDYIRPSISLSHELEVSSGDGTTSSPYVLELE